MPSFAKIPVVWGFFCGYFTPVLSMSFLDIFDVLCYNEDIILGGAHYN